MASSTPSKVRSPNYPTIGLRDAVARARKIYDQEQRHPADRSTLAKALGYGGINGASVTLISTLVKYGLLEPAGERDHMRVSPIAMDILLHDRGDAERVQAVRRAAFRPPLFAELRDRYPGGMPSEQNLRNYLTKRGFSQRAGDAAVRAYRDTMSFLNEETEGAVVRASDVDDVAETDELDEMFHEPEPPMQGTTTPDFQAILRAFTAGQTPPPSSASAEPLRPLPPQMGACRWSHTGSAKTPKCGSNSRGT